MNEHLDPIEEVHRLIDVLQQTTLSDYGDKLLNAIEGGSTGTEIYMTLSFNLNKLLAEDDQIDLIKAKAKKIKESIDNALAQCD